MKKRGRERELGEKKGKGRSEDR
jgi:hypothetical protein